MPIQYVGPAKPGKVRNPFDSGASVALDHRSMANKAYANARGPNDWRLERLIDRLPNRARSAVRFLRRPANRWFRIPIGILLTFGGILGFLPILGFWMLPIGLALFADDVPLLRSGRSRILDWIEDRHPGWLSPGSRPQ
jgi:hypothetical protein